MFHQYQATFNYFVTLLMIIHSNLWVINTDYFLRRLVAKRQPKNQISG